MRREPASGRTRTPTPGPAATIPRPRLRRPDRSDPDRSAARARPPDSPPRDANRSAPRVHAEPATDQLEVRSLESDLHETTALRREHCACHPGARAASGSVVTYVPPACRTWTHWAKCTAGVSNTTSYAGTPANTSGVVRSITASAPRAVTRSTSLVLHTPVTWPPSRLPIPTATEPMPPPAPTINALPPTPKRPRSRSDCRLVIVTVAAAAATWNGRASGLTAQASRGSVTYSA